MAAEVPDSEDTMFADEETGWYSSAIHVLYLSPCSYIYIPENGILMIMVIHMYTNGILLTI
jgi:hypothetical protein